MTSVRCYVSSRGGSLIPKKWDVSTLAFWGACGSATISLAVEAVEIYFNTDLYANSAEFDPFLHILAHIGIAGSVGAILFAAVAWVRNRIRRTDA
jgi:hypothetical protein